MQRQYYSAEVEKQVNRQFKGHDHVTSRYIPEAPVSPEREYVREMNAMMKIIKDALLEELPVLAEDYRMEMSYRTDGFTSLATKVDRMFERISKKLGDMIRVEDFGKTLKKLFKHEGRITTSQFKKAVRNTLGVDISQDYYNGDILNELMKTWVSTNVDLISTIPQNTLGDMKKIILEGYKSGLSTSEMTKKIMHSYSVSKEHAQFIARDQMAKLNCDITRKQHEEAGVKRFKWRTVGDQRVRKSHRDFNGIIYEYANPPVNERGEKVLPGSDYNCRCTAIPVFDKSTLALAIDTNKIEG